MKQLKVIILLSTILSFSAPLFASTNVTSISSDTDWYQNGSPYIIQGKVVIPKGATLRVNSGVQVIFQGAAALEVDGALEVEGSASAPAVFNMIEGNLRSELFINGGEAHIANAKILSGVFLVKDAQLTLEGSDITKGSGVYLQGATTAHLKNNKIYGNATGVVLDGQVTASLSFNTLVQNTYGLYLKSYSNFSFTNNSIHDNQREVINATPAMKLGGNYWGSTDSNSVHARIQGAVDLTPMRSLKDVLRIYVQTQLPVITGKMSAALAAREKKEAKEEALALKKLKKEQTAASKKAEAAPEPEAPAAEAPAAEAPAEKAPPAAEEAPAAETSVQEIPATPASKIITVKSLPAAPHKLKPLDNLPPAQVIKETEAASSSSPIGSLTPPSVPQPPVVAAPAESLVPPSLDNDLMPPPGLGSPAAAGTVPPPPDSMTIAPPPIGSSAAKSDSIPAPPDLGEQMTPAVSSAPVVPPPPASANNAPAIVQPPPVPVNVTPTADQQTAVKKLDTVSGDIDGMQPPPLDLGPDLSNPSAFDDMSGVGKPSSKAAPKSAPTSSGLALPPLKDADVAPPKDLDLPPIDDLGNINLDSRNK